MNDPLATIRRRLAARRCALGLTQNQLAEMLGTQQSVVSDWENQSQERRGSDMRLSTVVRWAQALGLTIDLVARDAWDES